MPIQPHQGILNIPNATLRVGKLAVDSTAGFDTFINVVERNTTLLEDVTEYTGTKQWDLKLPNIWVATFEIQGISSFNFQNTSVGTALNGYTLLFSGTTLTLKYGVETDVTLTTATIPNLDSVYGKVYVTFEKQYFTVTIDGTRVLAYKDTVARTAPQGGEFINFFDTSGAFKNLKIVAGNWISDGTSNVALMGGKLGIGTDTPEDTLHVNGGIRFGGHIIPTLDATFDIGSATNKIRDLFVTNNSLWIGDQTKIAFENGKLKFKRRKLDKVPKVVTDLAIAHSVPGVTDETTAGVAAVAYIQEHFPSDGITTLGDLKLQHWKAYTESIDPTKAISDIFVDNDEDYEAVTASEAFAEVGSDIYSAHNISIGKTTAPTSKLDVAGTVTATAAIFSGDVAVNTNTLFVDTSANSVGLGTVTPSANLHVTGNVYVSSNLEVGGDVAISSNLAVGISDLFVDTVNSRVGIGVTDPRVPLDVDGDIAVVSQQPPAALTHGTATSSISGHGDYTIDASRIDLGTPNGSIVSIFTPSNDGFWNSSADYTSGVANTTGTFSSLTDSGATIHYGAWAALELPYKTKLRHIIAGRRLHSTGAATFPSVVKVFGADAIGGTLSLITTEPIVIDVKVPVNADSSYKVYYFSFPSLTGTPTYLQIRSIILYTDTISVDYSKLKATTAEFSGNVGIGTTAPESLLHLSASTASADITDPIKLKIHNTTTAGDWSFTQPWGLLEFDTDDTNSAGSGPVAGIGCRFELAAGGDSSLCFYTDDAAGNDTVLGAANERMCINSDGLVGIGTTTPDFPLTIQETTTNTNTVTYPLALRAISSGTVDDGFGVGLRFQCERRDTDDYNGQAGSVEVYGTNIPGTEDRWNMRFGVRNDDTAVTPMTLQYDGNVGIGTTSPIGNLSVVRDTVVAGSDTFERGMFYKDGKLQITPPDLYSGYPLNGDFLTTTRYKTDGTTDFTGAAIGVDYTTTGSGGSSLYFKTASSASSLTEKVRITDTGNVGIGTNDPKCIFHVGVGDADLRIGAVNYSGTAANTTTYGLERSRNQILFSTWRDAQTNKIGAKISGINKQTYSSPTLRHLIQSTDLAFYTVPPDAANYDATIERLRITDTGNVGIGTTSPTQKLDVNGNVSVSGYILNAARPAFWAFRSDGAGTTTIGANGFDWNSTDVNVGSCFSTTTNAFTAPVSGYYHFFCQGLSRRGVGSGSIEMTLYKNGVNVSGRALAYEYMRDTSDHSNTSYSRIEYMTATHTMKMGATAIPAGTDIYYGERLGYFSGYLLG